MHRYLVIDCETGGLDPETCGITEIAAVVAEAPDDWSSCAIVERFSVLLRPVEGLLYEPRALEIQHRTLDDLRDGMSERYALSTLFGFTVGLHENKFLRIWAHNAEFDRNFFFRAIARANYGIDEDSKEFELLMPFPFFQSWLCSCNMFRTLHPGHSSARLDAVLSHYGIQIDPTLRHTALGDTIATAHAIARMKREQQYGRESVK